MIKTLFIGSNWEALETFQTLHADKRFDIVGLITQPDKPVGRKKELTQTEIKKYAKSQGIEVYHTESDPKRYTEAFSMFEPVLIVCKSFGEILPEKFIESPKYGTINVHYSLLPRYRGAVPIQKAILEGEEITGITYVKMVKELDAGEILKMIKHPIRPDDTNFSLRKRLVTITSETIGDVLEAWVNGEIDPIPQDNDKASYCWQKDISKENAFIDWEKHTPTQIDRMVRAFIPWPIAWTFYNGKRLKIFEASIDLSPRQLNPGEYHFEDDILYVGSIEAGTAIVLERVQLEGKTEMDARDFARGYQI